MSHATPLTCVRHDVENGVATVTLDRPERRNAISLRLVEELTRSLDAAEADPAVRVILLTGGNAVFAAGADVAEMANLTHAEVRGLDFSGACERLASCHKPVLAAVAGPALGGGCELVEMCDLVIAAETASFGHPEITLGTMSGCGGTQRLARLVGRHRAMDMCLTGGLITAQEALRIGLVSRIVPTERLMTEARAIAETIAGRSPTAVRGIKESINAAVSVGLGQGLRLERRLFHATFATGELRDGLRRFLERLR